MDAQSIRDRLALQADSLKELGVRSLLLFGSGAKGNTTSDSDLDFLVEYDGMATFDRYMNLKELLESELQTRIDLVTIRALKPLLRDQIFEEAIRIA